MIAIPSTAERIALGEAQLWKAFESANSGYKQYQVDPNRETKYVQPIQSFFRMDAKPLQMSTLTPPPPEKRSEPKRKEDREPYLRWPSGQSRSYMFSFYRTARGSEDYSASQAC